MTAIAPAEALRLLAAFDPQGDPHAAGSVERTRGLLETAAAPFARTAFDPGHVTASAVVLTADDRVLLVHHPRLARWLQPGGHVEPADRSLVDAARREVAEETGLRLPHEPEPPLVRVDVHHIPADRGEPAHWHHDFMFGYRVAAPEPAATTEHRVAWAPLRALEDYRIDAALRRGIEGAVHLLAT